MNIGQPNFIDVLYFYFFSANDLLPGGTQAFSSYPGSIFSGDDFYILSSGLVRTCTWHDRIEYYTLIYFILFILLKYVVILLDGGSCS